MRDKPNHTHPTNSEFSEWLKEVESDSPKPNKMQEPTKRGNPLATDPKKPDREPSVSYAVAVSRMFL
jgi:hypothetical protein